MLTGGPGNPLGQSETRQLQAAGRALGLDVLAIANADKDHLESAFATLVKTAKALGLTPPPDVLAVADEVIESETARLL